MDDSQYPISVFKHIADLLDSFLRIVEKSKFVESIEHPKPHYAKLRFIFQISALRIYQKLVLQLFNASFICLFGSDPQLTKRMTSMRRNKAIKLLQPFRATLDTKLVSLFFLTKQFSLYFWKPRLLFNVISPQSKYFARAMLRNVHFLSASLVYRFIEF